MPTVGKGLAAELKRRTRAEEEQENPPTTTRRTKPRKDDAGILCVRLPAKLKQDLYSHVEALKAQGVAASANSIIRVLVTEYLEAIDTGTREPPIRTTTKAEIGL